MHPDRAADSRIPRVMHGIKGLAFRFAADDGRREGSNPQGSRQGGSAPCPDVATAPDLQISMP